MEYITYAEGIRRLQRTWDFEPTDFAGGLTLNYNISYSNY
jgi:hypothetical protein